jgi:antitoxin CptB
MKLRSDGPKRPGAVDLLRNASMSGTGTTEHGLDVRRRRIRFRAWHRGMREVDLLLGGFADAHGDDLDAGEIAGFEALMDLPDPMVLAWIVGEEPIPDDDNSPILQRIVAFHRRRSAL